MKCSQIEELILQDVDEPISSSDMAYVQVHISDCASCSTFYRQVKAMAASMQSHSSEIHLQASEKELDFLVTAALDGESAVSRQSTSLLGLIGCLASSLFSTNVARIARVASAAALLLFASALVVDRVVDVEGCSTHTLGLGHIESFSAEIGPEGRVYATVIERNAAYSDEGGGAK